MIRKSTNKSESDTKRPSAYFYIVIGIMLLSASALGIKQWISSAKSDNPDIVIQSDSIIKDNPSASDLISRVARHTAVNQALMPTIAEVKNAYLLSLQDPTFYKDVENGDFVLIWPDKAVLYSYAKDVILNETSINNVQATSSEAIVESETTPPSETVDVSATGTTDVAEVENTVIEVRNGSGRVGMGKSMSEKLTAIGMNVLKPSDAKIRKWYEKTIIIKNSEDGFPQTEQSLIDALNAEVVVAPQGELPLKGDFLIIVGQDYNP
ncbi:LytR C-terminal domain-containing protein [Patescibacteria group bacterium]|nr:LytR C-terminal domain-containing protein [Patescibacteria group bacterium]